ncbi:MAG: N-acetyltransferase [Pseudomonadota bacterium]|nr:N-acetyltransferase [Pseudomonadota bacterium]
MFTLAQEKPEDWWEVEALYDHCFAPGRTALSSYRLRDGIAPVSNLCLVARDEVGQVGGAIRYWPIRVGGVKSLLLGPVAVHPIAQGEGLGALLITKSLEVARDDWDRVLLVGDAPYYSRFGFQKLDGVEMPPPTNPDRILGYPLKDGAWNGIKGKVRKAKPPLT